ncbi:MAG: alpha/beta hydrolase [Geminocystis sp.]|nr:alpha/beta hydrolase [Geminocystis sp.]MCS7148136.1 alpha/beta hydrolase [Geminocystis sp.]MCX8078089.1 alpha/beta hydrolase [Geminocystis sp.]MDW8116487.1 alpha/beta hydrolase [Geminocystis sp.]HIK36954.1 alpha/beta hydrolase [Geminocystis sp. M7585_C2015_104]
MYTTPEVVWLNTNPYLRRFNLPVIKHLSQYLDVAHWEYELTEDESTSHQLAIDLLDDYLSLLKKPVHLVGHSTCGFLGLQYASRYPEKVKSLTLLGVGVNPAMDWVGYYYLLRRHFKCSQEVILNHLGRCLFGYGNSYYQKSLVKLLQKALVYSLSPHSLYKRHTSFPVKTITPPLMVCGSREDQIVFWTEIEKWELYLKTGDRICQCPKGGHFFHYFHPQWLGERILDFWISLGEYIPKKDAYRFNFLTTSSPNG